MSLERCRVVLVRPTTASNVGAAARAMRNMGVRDLVLVAPQCDPADPQAALLATSHAVDVLRAARVVADMEAAVGDCLFVAATSAKTAGLFRESAFATPEEGATRLLRALASGPAALVFGPESSGLTNDEIARCDALIHIPADPDYPVLNLAQSVIVCLYALRSAGLRQEQPPPAAPPAPFAARARAYAHLQQALEEIHFLYGAKADALMHALRRLLDRAEPTMGELKILHGLARQIEWSARQTLSGRPRGDAEERRPEGDRSTGGT